MATELPYLIKSKGYFTRPVPINQPCLKRILKGDSLKFWAVAGLKTPVGSSEKSFCQSLWLKIAELTFLIKSSNQIELSYFVSSVGNVV